MVKDDVAMRTRTNGTRLEEKREWETPILVRLRASQAEHRTKLVADGATGRSHLS